MGYSGRYHAASLAAVFLALAVGILIGVGFASDVVTGTAESLEEDLSGELTETRAQVEELEAELESERDLAQRLYPAIVGDRLTGQRVTVIGFGGLADEISVAVDSAIDPTGAVLAEVAVVRAPPDSSALIESLLGITGDRLSEPDAVERAGFRAGRALGTGRGPFDEVRRLLLTRFSGEPGMTNYAVVFRQVPDDLDDDAATEAEALESGMIEGLRSAGATVVGVERTDEEVSSIEHFEGYGIATVDNVDTLAGRVALVFALGGARGSYGVKDTADRLLPELLPPIARPATVP